MSETPTVLPFRFFNFERKNLFLKVVQAKGFEVLSENQTILRSVTTGKQQGGSLDINSYSVRTHTENTVAYDVNIKKVLDEQDKQYINLLAEYFNYNGTAYPGFIGTVIFVYIVVFGILFAMAYILPHAIRNVIGSIPKDMATALFWSSGPIGYYYLRKRIIKSNDKTNQNYQKRLKPYLEPAKSK